LKQTAKILKIFRTEDLVARIGRRPIRSSHALVGPIDRRKCPPEAQEDRRGPQQAAQRRAAESIHGLATGEKGCSLFDLLTQAEAAMK